MVVVKGGGQTYSIGNGRQMEWADVPESFKRKLNEQKEIMKCIGMREEAQQCIEQNGFWDSRCVELTEAFHLCQANELTNTELPRKKNSTVV